MYGGGCGLFVGVVGNTAELMLNTLGISCILYLYRQA